MCFGINIKANAIALFSHGAPGRVFGPIRHNNGDLVIVGVNVFFHGQSTFKSGRVYTQPNAGTQGFLASIFGRI